MKDVAAVATPEVLICGAGAAGLTLAIDLALQGVSFRIIDKLASPFAGSRGKAVQPRTQEVFEDLGIIDRLAAVGGSYPPQREYHADGSSDDDAEQSIFEPPTAHRPKTLPHAAYGAAVSNRSGDAPPAG